MKTTLVKTSLLLLLISILTFGCEKNHNNGDEKSDTEYSGPVTGYIVGSFVCEETDSENGQATGNQTARAYCILLKNSRNASSDYPMDFYTFDLPDNLYTIPNEILSVTYDGGNCGPHFFPDSLRNTYKISFKFQVAGSDDKVGFVCGPCTAMYLSFPWQNFDQILVKEVSKE